MSEVVQIQRATIVRGEDRSITLKFLKANGDPFPLTGQTKIAVQFRKQDNQILEVSTSAAGGYQASAVYAGVTYTSVNVGAGGNSIVLTFDGNTTIHDFIAAYNTAHPLWPISSNATDTLVKPAAGSVTLAGGVDAAAKVTIIGSEPKLGQIQVSLDERDTGGLRLGKNQSVRAYVDFGAAPQGTRRYCLFRDSLDVIDSEF